jgi:hypothetical protein
MDGGEIERERALFDGLKESASEVLDLFTGVDQSDVAAGRVDLDELSREDRIELIVDGETSSVFGSSPWSVGLGLDASVAQQIHAQKGATLVFAINAGILDFAQSVARAPRYVLMWDDTVPASGPGIVPLKVADKTFLIVTVTDLPAGRNLTLWITDDDISVTLVKQGRLNEVDTIRKEIVGELKDSDRDSNPFVDAIDSVGAFLTVSQIGGVVALAVIGLVLVLVVRSESIKDVAKTAAKVV